MKNIGFIPINYIDGEKNYLKMLLRSFLPQEEEKKATATNELEHKVNYHRQRRWLDIFALKGALLGLVVILCIGAYSPRSYRFFAAPKSWILIS